MTSFVKKINLILYSICMLVQGYRYFFVESVTEILILFILYSLATLCMGISVSMDIFEKYKKEENKKFFSFKKFRMNKYIKKV